LSYTPLALVGATDEASDEAELMDSGYFRKTRVKCKHKVWSAVSKGKRKRPKA